MVYVGAKSCSMSIFLRDGSSRKWPYVARHLYPGPKYSSIFLHFAGDSTMTSVVDVAE
jgi:hypothetical protein